MVKNRSLVLLFGFFTLLLALLLIWMLAQARGIDVAWHGAVPTTGDDDDYQRLAINLRHSVGYTESMVLPLETYLLDLTSSYGMEYERQFREQGSIMVEPSENFYRAPGYPILLSAIYTVFGDSTLVARQATVVMVWMIAMLVMATGSIWAGWRGTLAGGIVGLLYMLPYVRRFRRLFG